MHFWCLSYVHSVVSKTRHQIKILEILVEKSNDLIQLFIFTFKQIDRFFRIKIFVVFEIFVNFDIHKISFRIIDFQTWFFDFIINSAISRKICLLYFFCFDWNRIICCLFQIFLIIMLTSVQLITKLTVRNYLYFNIMSKSKKSNV